MEVRIMISYNESQKNHKLDDYYEDIEDMDLFEEENEED